ncbi:MAG: hypothetical protein NVS9B1_03370 [Candidatus Dormibacteraceae bacterium]
MTDEYSAAGAAGRGLYPVYVTTRTRTGLLANFYPIGPAVLALPFYLVALAVGGGADQYADPLAWSYLLTSLLAGLLALGLCYRITRSVPAVIGAAVATPLLYYLLFTPSYSHTFSAFTVSLFVWAWLRGRGPLLLGLLGGLMALVRPQDGPLVLIALLDLPRLRWRAILLLPGAVIAFAPQLWVDRTIFGTWLPAGTPEGFTPIPGHYWQVLFSSWRGLFTWNPITLIAVAGFVLVRDWRLRVALVYALLVETAINGAVGDWWGGFAFGGRRFLDLLPFFAIGIAAVAERIRPAAARIGLAVLSAWNVILIANLTYVIGTAADPGWRLLTGQLPAISFLPRLLVQGHAVRALLLGPRVHEAFDPVGAATLLLLEGACVAVALALGLNVGAPDAQRAPAGPLRDDADLQRGTDAGDDPGTRP